MSELCKSVSALVEEMVKDIPGWSPLDQLVALFQLVYSSTDVPGDIVEIGSWCGRSSVALGLGAKLSGRGSVICVDLFPARNDWYQLLDGNYTFDVTVNGQVFRGYHPDSVWKEPFERDIAPIYKKHDSVYDSFQESVARAGLSGVVQAIRGNSDSLATMHGRPFRLGFIDGDHNYESVRRDIIRVDSLLAPGGWICLDDAFSSYAGVDRAIEELILPNPCYELGTLLTRKLFIARKRRELLNTRQN
jgi:predicted O-methyltransferase YrrM